jgi:membrane protein implicated in regulation of membrane protease activity
MEFQASTLWWVLAGALVIAELLTGTFYLLMLALGSVAAAVAASNADVNMDIGQTVHVTEWLTDGQARVPYRGAAWTVRHVGDGSPEPGAHRIIAVHGNVLDVQPSQKTPPLA